LKRFGAGTHSPSPSALPDDDERIRREDGEDEFDEDADASMDPAFAHVLSPPGKSSVPLQASPLRQGTTRYDFEDDDEDDEFEHVGLSRELGVRSPTEDDQADSSRTRRRPGVGLRAGPDSRPGSLVGTPSALAAELGLSPGHMQGHIEGEHEVRLALTWPHITCWIF
jgi:hypothetical protein